MMKPKRKRKTLDAFSVISIVVALFIVFFICSAILAVLISGAGHLSTALASAEMWFSLKVSLITATISTALCMLLSIPASYAFTRTDMPLKKVSEVLMELMMCLPYIVLGLCLLTLFSTEFGKWLKSIGFKVVFDVKGIVIAQLFVNLPFAMRLIRTAFMQVDARLEVIAGMLGASKWKQLITITLPLCRNSLISTLVLIWSRAIGEFGATLMLVGITRMKTETLPGSIYLNIATGDNGLAMASAMIMMVISGVTLVLTNRLNHLPKYYRISGDKSI